MSLKYVFLSLLNNSTSNIGNMLRKATYSFFYGNSFYITFYIKVWFINIAVRYVSVNLYRNKYLFTPDMSALSYILTSPPRCVCNENLQTRRHV